MEQGSSIFRDTAELMLDNEVLPAIDMGSWLFRRADCQFLTFETKYSHWELDNSVTEDDKLLSEIVRLEVPIACSEKPTLIYRLGGYSNKRHPLPAMHNGPAELHE